MSKFSDNFKKYLQAYIATFVVSFLVGVVIFLLVFFLSKNKMTLVGAINSSAISGVILFSLGVLAFVSNMGMFDSLTYGFNQLGSSLFGKKANKFHDFNEYRDEKIMKRKVSANYYWPILISSIPYIIALVILEIILHV